MIAIYNVTPEQMREMLPTSPVEAAAIVHAGELSRPLLAAMWEGEAISFFGFIPQTVISDTAHLWMWVGPNVDRHRVAFARESRRVIANMQRTYSSIIGYCGTPRSIAWLRWLGAEFYPPANGLYPFEIRRWG